MAWDAIPCDVCGGYALPSDPRRTPGVFRSGTYVGWTDDLDIAIKQLSVIQTRTKKRELSPEQILRGYEWLKNSDLFSVYLIHGGTVGYKRFHPTTTMFMGVKYKDLILLNVARVSARHGLGMQMWSMKSELSWTATERMLEDPKFIDGDALNKQLKSALRYASCPLAGDLFINLAPGFLVKSSTDTEFFRDLLAHLSYRHLAHSRALAREELLILINSFYKHFIIIPRLKLSLSMSDYRDIDKLIERLRKISYMENDQAEIYLQMSFLNGAFEDIKRLNGDLSHFLGNRVPEKLTQYSLELCSKLYKKKG